MAVGETVDLIAGVTDHNFFRHAFVIFIVLAGGYFAGADAGGPLRCFRMRRRRVGQAEIRVAAGVRAIPDGDGSCMTTIVCVVRAFGDRTLRYDRHLD